MYELQKRLFFINYGDCRQFPFKLRCKDCMFNLQCTDDPDFSEDEIYQEVEKMLNYVKNKIETNESIFKQRRLLEKNNCIGPTKVNHRKLKNRKRFQEF